MTAKITKILNAPGIASEVLLKAVGKIAPGLGPFIAGAQGAGYLADQVADFLRNKYLSKEERRHRNQVEERSAEGTARPDERAELQRYEQMGSPGEALSGLAKFGSRIGGGLSQVHHASELQKAGEEESAATNAETTPTEVPAIDQVPKSFHESLIQNAQKGQKAINLRQGAEKAKNLAPGQQAATQAAQQAPAPVPAPQERTLDRAARFIAQFPDLGKFIDEAMKKGSSPRDAALLAKKKRIFSPSIERIEKDIGQSFVDIVDNLFTGRQGEAAQAAQPSQPQTNERSTKIKAGLADLANFVRGK